MFSTLGSARLRMWRHYDMVGIMSFLVRKLWLEICGIHLYFKIIARTTYLVILHGVIWIHFRLSFICLAGEKKEEKGKKKLTMNRFLWNKILNFFKFFFLFSLFSSLLNRGLTVHMSKCWGKKMHQQYQKCEKGQENWPR